MKTLSDILKDIILYEENTAAPSGTATPGTATPGNTIGMGNPSMPSINQPGTEPLPTAKALVEQPKKKKKKYPTESLLDIDDKKLNQKLLLDIRQGMFDMEEVLDTWEKLTDELELVPVNYKDFDPSITPGLAIHKYILSSNSNVQNGLLTSPDPYAYILYVWARKYSFCVKMNHLGMMFTEKINRNSFRALQSFLKTSACYELTDDMVNFFYKLFY